MGEKNALNKHKLDWFACEMFKLYLNTWKDTQLWAGLLPPLPNYLDSDPAGIHSVLPKRSKPWKQKKRCHSVFPPNTPPYYLSPSPAIDSGHLWIPNRLELEVVLLPSLAEYWGDRHKLPSLASLSPLGLTGSGPLL